MSIEHRLHELDRPDAVRQPATQSRSQPAEDRVQVRAVIRLKSGDEGHPGPVQALFGDSRADQ